MSFSCSHYSGIQRLRSSKDNKKTHVKDVFPGSKPTPTEEPSPADPHEDDLHETHLPPAEDEETVNISTVLLLQGFTFWILEPQIEWAPNRFHFPAMFKTVMNAICDGK